MKANFFQFILASLFVMSAIMVVVCMVASVASGEWSSNTVKGQSAEAGAA